MANITIELDRWDALLLRDFLGRTNYYLVGAVLCNGSSDTEKVTEDDVARHDSAVLHAYVALQNALGE